MFDWQNIVSRKTTSRYRVSIRSNHSVHFTLRINPCNKCMGGEDGCDGGLEAIIGTNCQFIC